MSEDGEPERRLGLRAVIGEGFALATSRSGLLLLGAFFAIQLLTNLLLTAGGLTYLPLDQAAGVIGERSGLPVGSDLSLAATVVAIALVVAFTIAVNVPLGIVAIRTFVAGATERIPDEALFHRLGRATLSSLAAALLFASMVALALVIGAAAVCLALQNGEPASAGQFLTGLGIVALVVLAFFAIWLHLVFVAHEIAVRDRGVIDAVRGSLRTVRGQRWRLFGLFVVQGVLTVAASEVGPDTVGGDIDAIALATLAVESGLSAAVTTVTIAVFAVAYRTVSPDDAVRTGRFGRK